jgi:DNA gyrase subunit A
MEDLIADEPCVITISSEGYIKRVPIDAYRQQRRGGKGVIAMNTKDEDFVQHVFMASTHDYLLCFTETGRMHWLKAYRIPESIRQGKGRAIINLLNFEKDERFAAAICVREFSDRHHLVKATRKGIIKKTNLSAYSNIRSGGIIAIRIDDDDQLIGVKLTNGENDIMLTTRNGQSIRFDEGQLRDQGRATRGVKGITLRDGDAVIGIDIVDEGATILAVTENGYGKRSPFPEYRRQVRGGKGIITIKTTQRNGKVVVAHTVRDSDALMVVSQGGQMIRFAISDVKVIGRNTQGVKLFTLAEGDRLISASPIRTDIDEGTSEQEESEGESEVKSAEE